MTWNGHSKPPALLDHGRDQCYRCGKEHPERDVYDTRGCVSCRPELAPTRGEAEYVPPTVDGWLPDQVTLEEVKRWFAQAEAMREAGLPLSRPDCDHLLCSAAANIRAREGVLSTECEYEEEAERERDTANNEEDGDE